MFPTPQRKRKNFPPPHPASQLLDVSLSLLGQEEGEMFSESKKTPKWSIWTHLARSPAAVVVLLVAEMCYTNQHREVFLQGMVEVVKEGKSHCILINRNKSRKAREKKFKANLSLRGDEPRSIQRDEQYHLVKSYDYEIIYRAHSAAPCFCSANLCLPIVMLCGSGRVEFVLT